MGEVIKQPTLANLNPSDIIRCKQCSNKGDPILCPMVFEETFYNESWEEWDSIIHDNTIDNGYCDRGEIRVW